MYIYICIRKPWLFKAYMYHKARNTNPLSLTPSPSATPGCPAVARSPQLYSQNSWLQKSGFTSSGSGPTVLGFGSFRKLGYLILGSLL